jgi:hypothetical protein
MTDRISGSKNNPYQVAPATEKPATEKPGGGRAKAVRTHARRGSLAVSGVDIASAEKKPPSKERESVHKLITKLAEPNADARAIAAKCSNLCKKYDYKVLAQIFASKMRELAPGAREKIESNLDWVASQATSKEATELVMDMRSVLAKRAKNRKSTL